MVSFLNNLAEVCDPGEEGKLMWEVPSGSRVTIGL